MKSLTEQLWFEVPNRRGFVNITDTVEKLVAKSGVSEGQEVQQIDFLKMLDQGI